MTQVKSRTVLVLDCSEQCIDPFLGGDISLSLKSGTSLYARKTTLTGCVEALTEYCRVLYDLFPDSNPVSVVASGDKPFQLNGWNFSEQSLKQILREFTFVRPETVSNVGDTLDLAVQTLAESSSVSSLSPQCKFRIVLLLQHQPGLSGFEYQDGDNIIDVSEVVNHHILRANKNGANSVFIPNCELIVLRLLDPNGSESIPPPSPPKSVGKVLANLQYLQTKNLTEAFSDLAQRHHSMGRLRIKGMPMRETIPHAQREFHDVVLLFDSSSTPHLVQSENVKGYNGLGTTTKKEIVVRWKSNDKRLNPDTLPCKSAHRVTPQIVSASSSMCLMKHICSGHPVFLVTHGSESNFVSHALLLQGTEVVLHALHAPTPAEGLPLHIYMNNVDNYRVKEFVEIVDSNILQLRPKSMKQPPPLERVQLNTKSTVSYVGTIQLATNPSSSLSSSSISSSATIPAPPSDTTTPSQSGAEGNITQSGASTPPSTSIPLTNTNTSGKDEEPGKIVSVLAPRNLERYTRYFPWTEGDSLLYNSNEQCEDLRRLLDPFKRNMLKEYLNEEYVDTLTELINRMVQFANANDLRLFPNLGKSAVQRKEAYKRLWADCHNFAQVCASTVNHAKMVTLMERLWPEPCGITPPAPPTPTTPTSTTPPIPSSSSSSSSSSQPLPGQASSSQSQSTQQNQNDNQRRASYQEINFVPQKPKAEPDSDDLWNQFEQSRKYLEESELQAEREKQMLATMPESERDPKRRRQSNADTGPPKAAKVEFNDTSSLFSKYWTAHASKHTSHEDFDGQQDEQFQLYADLK